MPHIRHLLELMHPPWAPVNHQRDGTGRGFIRLSIRGLAKTSFRGRLRKGRTTITWTIFGVVQGPPRLHGA